MGDKHRILSLMKEVIRSGARCSAHSSCSHGGLRRVKSDNCDYAFEMTCNNIRYGPGVTGELGMDVVNFNAKKVTFGENRFTNSWMVLRLF